MVDDDDSVEVSGTPFDTLAEAKSNADSDDSVYECLATKRFSRNDNWSESIVKY